MCIQFNFDGSNFDWKFQNTLKFKGGLRTEIQLGLDKHFNDILCIRKHLLHFHPLTVGQIKIEPK